MQVNDYRVPLCQMDITFSPSLPLLLFFLHTWLLPPNEPSAFHSTERTDEEPSTDEECPITAVMNYSVRVCMCVCVCACMCACVIGKCVCVLSACGKALCVIHPGGFMGHVYKYELEVLVVGVMRTHECRTPSRICG